MIPRPPNRTIPRPFADGGSYESQIPDTGAATGRASYTLGFPDETQRPIEAGGVAPSRLDFNGMFNILSAFAFWMQSGGQWTYSATLSYVKPSIVFYDGKLWWCEAENGVDSVNGVVPPGTNENYWKELLTALQEQGGGVAPAESGVPVGTILPIYHSSGAIQREGYFYCDGSSFSSTQYPLLYAALGKTQLPDLRGIFVRGWDYRGTPQNPVDPDSPRVVGSTQDYAIQEINFSIRAIAPDTNYPETDMLNMAIVRTSNAAVGFYKSNTDLRSYAYDPVDKSHVSTETRPINMAIPYYIKHD